MYDGQKQYFIALLAPNHQVKARFNVELAVTEDELQKGLSNRNTLAKDHGMLFIFAPARYVLMWMKNTFLRLDILFFDEDGYVIYMIFNAELNTDESLGPPSQKSSYVLEVPAGEALRHKISIGDKLLLAEL